MLERSILLHPRLCEGKNNYSLLDEPYKLGLSVIFQDSGSPQQSAYTVIKVRILDSNDNDPEITVRYFPDPSKSYASVSPDVGVDTSVAAITVTDNDKV